MQEIQKKFIVDDKNRKVAVQIEYKIFTKIEEILENYALFKLMEENDDSDLLNHEQAKGYYQTLQKAK